MRLPKAQNDVPAESGEAGARHPLVAVVDDDAAVCGSLKFSLELEGFSVHTYSNAAALLQVDDFAACDCLVVDQRMPEMSGMELIEQLRRQNVVTPAILIISYPNIAVAAWAAKAAVPIVEKPLLGNALVEQIRMACR